MSFLTPRRYNHQHPAHGGFKTTATKPVSFCTSDTETRRRTHSEHGDESSLQQPHHYVTPVVFVVGHTCVTNIQRKRHQEELDGWSNQSRPLSLHPGLDIKLYTHNTFFFKINRYLNLNFFICKFCVCVGVCVVCICKP